MKSVLHKAATRGHADHGWLNSWHSFSFAGYYDPQRMNFGVLRVLNDDTVAGGMGFGKHPHDNMEIISIPLEGDLEHQDDTGTKAVIRKGDVQIMSAGTGIAHSEKNASAHDAVKFLQIWVIPNKRNVAPRYDQQSFQAADTKNVLINVVSPVGAGEGVQIHQDAWFSLGKLDAGTELRYDLKKQGNGVYIFVLEGQLMIDDILLDRRDGFGLWEIDHFTINATTGAEVLVMEVPMK
ncbi:MAG TPA: pirin family protein [Flavisolibacter sp.]|nr:pirin family protein [Flavisolibacter sp.]